jgi:hypothetical protein
MHSRHALGRDSNNYRQNRKVLGTADRHRGGGLNILDAPSMTFTVPLLSYAT